MEPSTLLDGVGPEGDVRTTRGLRSMAASVGLAQARHNYYTHILYLHVYQCATSTLGVNMGCVHE